MLKLPKPSGSVQRLISAGHSARNSVTAPAKAALLWCCLAPPTLFGMLDTKRPLPLKVGSNRSEIEAGSARRDGRAQAGLPGGLERHAASWMMKYFVSRLPRPQSYSQFPPTADLLTNCDCSSVRYFAANQNGAYMQLRSMRNLLRVSFKVCQAWQLCYFWTGGREFSPPMEVALAPRGIRRRHGA